MAVKSICKIEGCGKPVDARGWCNGHYARWQRLGDVRADIPLREKGKDPWGWLRAYQSHQEQECLTWPFAKYHNGYGKIQVNGSSNMASRMMCVIAHGEPPTPLHEAAHSCGNGHLACVNPRHLRWATVMENQADRTMHGRDCPGEKNGRAKLTMKQVERIRALRGVVRQVDLAVEYGVNQPTISAIQLGRLWSHVA